VVVVLVMAFTVAVVPVAVADSVRCPAGVRVSRVRDRIYGGAGK
jgi:hypothetical protein